MLGLLRRLVRGGDAGVRAPQEPPPASAEPAPPAPPPVVEADATREVPAVAPAPEPTAVPLPAHAPAPVAVAELPADADPGEAVVPASSWRRRSALRRRARYLRRVRELGLRDLGGLVLDLHRFGRERPDLVAAKLASLTALEAERRALEAALGTPRTIDLVREPGLASCPRCGALHPSEARFCAHCGLDLTTEHAPAEVGPATSEPIPGAAAATAETHGT
jgi:hypothetical protein